MNEISGRSVGRIIYRAAAVGATTFLGVLQNVDWFKPTTPTTPPDDYTLSKRRREYRP